MILRDRLKLGAVSSIALRLGRVRTTSALPLTGLFEALGKIIYEKYLLSLASRRKITKTNPCSGCFG
jgi:hypothetical protein